jgi:pimeloyl-ACP methyl ester carboxylesterase
MRDDRPDNERGYKARRRKWRFLVLLAALVVGTAWWWSMNTTALPEFFTSEEARNRYMAAYEAALQSWPVDHEELEIPTSMGPTHVIASGSSDAPSLILLHAAFATAVVWRPNVEALSRDFRVYAIDIVGQGGKTVTSRRMESRQDYADWLSEVFDGLGVEKASIVGNSYGGFLALNQASLTPERIDKVVLISPAGVYFSMVPFMGRMAFQGLAGPFRRLLGGESPGKLDISFLLGKKGHFNPDDRYWLALGEQLLDGSVRPRNMIMPSVFPKGELGAIEAPTLLLVAEYEILYEPHGSVRLARERMPRLEAEIVRGAHHLAAMAQPDAVNTRIIQFIGRGEESK